MTKKQKTIVALVFVVVFIALTCFCFLYKDYSRHTFEYMDAGFTWDMTMEDAEAYIEKNQVQTWRTIEVTDDEVSDGFYSFDFEDGKLYRVRFDMGMDKSIINTCNNWFGEYDKHKDSKYGDFGYYYWYGKMAGKKTEALLYCPSDTVYLHFTLVE